MEENAKGTMYADVLLVSKVIIVKLAEDLHNVRPAQEHAEMELASLIIHVSVSLAGSESCAIKTSHGLEHKDVFSTSGIAFIASWINATRFFI